MNKRGSRALSFFAWRKRGSNLLTENVIFIILNLVFFAIIIGFIFSKTGSSALMEEKMAKQAALIIDSAKPVTVIKMNVEDALATAKKEKYTGNIILSQGNTVTVKLRDNGGYSYSFFNNVNVSIFPDSSQGDVKDYIIVINNYKNG
jgi:hypothetical protein